MKSFFHDEKLYLLPVAGAAGAGVAAGFATCGAGAAAGFSAFIASSFVIRPPMPVPCTDAASMPFSAKTLAATGDG